MRKSLRIWLLLGGLLVLLLAGVVAWVYWAARQVPDWYESTLAETNSAIQNEASDQMEQRAAELISGLETTGDWKVLFTEPQINGWLAWGLKQKHADALPEGFTNPRVKIEPDGICAACRVERGGVSGVVSLKVDVYLAEPSVVAIRLHRVRLGRLPWPLNKIKDGISAAAREAEVPLSWKHAKNDPVAIIKIPLIEGDKRIRIEALHLDQGKLYVAGVTEREKK